MRIEKIETQISEIQKGVSKKFVTEVQLTEYKEELEKRFCDIDEELAEVKNGIFGSENNS